MVTGFGLFLILLPFTMLLLHEITHIAVARLASPVEVKWISTIPIRIQLDYERDPSPIHHRLVGLSPLLVGITAAVVGVLSGFWAWIQQLEPYYFYHLIALNWLVYSHLSPTDLRLAVWPPQEA